MEAHDVSHAEDPGCEALQRLLTSMARCDSDLNIAVVLLVGKVVHHCNVIDHVLQRKRRFEVHLASVLLVT